MKRRSDSAVVALVAVAALVGLASPARAQPDLEALFAKAVQSEQTAAAPVALADALALLDAALASRAPDAEAALLVALDLLARRDVVPLESLRGENGALLARHPGARPALAARLDRAYPQAAQLSPFAAIAVARVGVQMAMLAGDAAAAATWRARTGCARQATVLSRLDWPAVTALDRPLPFERPGARLEASYPGVAPFAGRIAPVQVEAYSCTLELSTASVLEGLRALVVDVQVDRPQRIAIELESQVASVLVVGGRTALVRPHHLGGRRVRQRAFAEVGAGRLRLVVRAAANEDALAALFVVGADGRPLPLLAPRVGESAPATCRAAGPVTLPAAREGEVQPLAVAAQLALGQARAAVYLLEAGPAPAATRGPLWAWLDARAVGESDHLPDRQALERTRQDWAALLQGWPRSWEALLGQALLAEREHGQTEGRIEALARITAARTRLPGLDPAVPALEAALATWAGLRDRAETARAVLAKQAPGTLLEALVEKIAGERVGAEYEALVCKGVGAAGIDRSGEDCLAAHVTRGDRAGALAEIERRRTLLGSSQALGVPELVQHAALGQTARALEVYERLPPGRRPLGALSLLAGDPKTLRERLFRDLPAAVNDSAAVAALTTLLGDSPAPALQNASAELIAQDRRKGATGGGATLVLAHRESYTLAASGALRYSLYDLRRISGTGDVNDAAVAVAPQEVGGGELNRSLRRRIFKPDGRVLDPEASVSQSQGRTDLSQLEPGDYLEEISEGFSVPHASGQMFVLTPDLLPERTSVQEASIEIRRPAALALGVWANPRLGKGTTRRQGAELVTTFTLRNAPPRRMESGVPRTEHSVAVYLGTGQWQGSGRLLAETIATLTDQNPFVSRWARGLIEASAPRDERAIAGRVVAAVGQAIKRADPWMLIDSSWARLGAQRTSARTMLELGEGSRTWLAYRALRELGLRAEIAVAEPGPFSGDPAYPYKTGRFSRPLIVVHGKAGDFWLDLDVQGPPLPVGRVSPQLQGRLAVKSTGGLFVVPRAATGAQATEVGVDLSLDEKGTARGTFTAALRGSDALRLVDNLPYTVGFHRDNMLRAVVLGWLPSASVNQVAMVSDDGATEVVVKAEVELPGYGQLEGAAWLLPGLDPLHTVHPTPAVSTLASRFAGSRQRENTLSIEEAVQYRVRRRVQLPVSARLLGAAPALQVRDPQLQAARRLQLTGGGVEAGPVIDEHFELSLATAALDPRGAQRFILAATRIDEGFQIPLRVTVGKPPAP